VQFYPGVSYRNLMVWARGKHRVTVTPPHDIAGSRWVTFCRKGTANKVPASFDDEALAILRGHQINKDRIEAGKPPANGIWLWGHGKAPKLPKLTERYGLSASMISALDLPRGLGLTCGFESQKCRAPRAPWTPIILGRPRARSKKLEKRDLVYIHLGATDDASHRGDVQAKVRAIESFDEHTVGTLLKGLPKLGPHRVLAVCNHATPVAFAVPYERSGPVRPLRRADVPRSRRGGPRLQRGGRAGHEDAAGRRDQAVRQAARK